MKKVAILMCTALALSACSKVPAGYKGVKVYLLGSEKGIESEELGVGRYWIGMNEELYLFPIFTQNYTWEKEESISFQTVEGMAVSADLGISYYVKAAMVTDVFEKYRKGIDEITAVYLRNIVRDALNQAASKMPIAAVYGEGKVSLINDVQAMVQAEAGKNGIVVERLYWAGELRLPQEVVDALNRKMQSLQEAQQRLNEVETVKAEAAKKVAAAQGEADSILAVAKAQSEANRILAESLTDQLIAYQWAKAWDGKLPYYSGGTGAPTPIFNMGQ